MVQATALEQRRASSPTWPEYSPHTMWTVLLTRNHKPNFKFLRTIQYIAKQNKRQWKGNKNEIALLSKKKKKNRNCTRSRRPGKIKLFPFWNINIFFNTTYLSLKGLCFLNNEVNQRTRKGRSGKVRFIVGRRIGGETSPVYETENDGVFLSYQRLSQRFKRYTIGHAVSNIIGPYHKTNNE